jgi:hypothetical protein
MIRRFQQFSLSIKVYQRLCSKSSYSRGGIRTSRHNLYYRHAREICQTVHWRLRILKGSSILV